MAYTAGDKEDEHVLRTLHEETNMEGVTTIPKNIFRKAYGTNVFRHPIEERHAYEQFFWTKETVEGLVKACAYVFEEKTCCLCTPSLAYGWHERGREERLLDIDKRFDFLPSFRYYDVRDPSDLGETFRLLIIDPPFFCVPIETIRDAVDKICGHDYSTKIIIAFLTRAEARLRTAFKHYQLQPTNFRLNYASIKPNKWKNFTLYSNIDLPGIKRQKDV